MRVQQSATYQTVHIAIGWAYYCLPTECNFRRLSVRKNYPSDNLNYFIGFMKAENHFSVEKNYENIYIFLY